MAVKNSKELMFYSKLKYRCFEVADYDLASQGFQVTTFCLTYSQRIWRHLHVSGKDSRSPSGNPACYQTSKFKLAVLIWRLKMRNSLGFSQYWKTGVFEVTDQDFPIRLSKFIITHFTMTMKSKKKD